MNKMKIRNGFVSNSSSSSFIIALPKSYSISDEEMVVIRDIMEDYDEYFSHYEELAEEADNTEMLDEREKIQMMLDGKSIPEYVEPVNDDIKNADIKKGFELLTTTGYFWSDEIYGDIPTQYAAKAIVEVLKDKIIVGSTKTTSDAGQIINILADEFVNSKGMQMVKDVLAK
jgi:hypothetical protein